MTLKVFDVSYATTGHVSQAPTASDCQHHPISTSKKTCSKHFQTSGKRRTETSQLWFHHPKKPLFFFQLFWEVLFFPRSPLPATKPKCLPRPKSTTACWRRPRRSGVWRSTSWKWRRRWRRLRSRSWPCDLVVWLGGTRWLFLCCSKREI